jgi:lipid II:glycine glycyltransferase (peptidoglycan interpeptide bridge formation enzyme)
MVYKYGCSDQTANRFGGTPMLFWRTIQEAKDNHQDELDMGRSDADGVGIIAFKQRWGALASTLQYWNYPGRELSTSNLWLKKARKTAAGMAPDFVLQMVGSLLYPHIG